MVTSQGKGYGTQSILGASKFGGQAGTACTLGRQSKILNVEPCNASSSIVLTVCTKGPPNFKQYTT